jgi:hypothetical protein
MNFDIDLTGHEIERRALVAEATPATDERRAEADEKVAWAMLYGDLDEGQQKIYQSLVDQGVLPSAE